MRLPPHVIRRRQGLYLRLRLPPDLARLTGRSHTCQSLRTGDPCKARGLAAARVAGPHAAWQEARLLVVATFRGKVFEALGPDDIVAIRKDLPAAMAELEAMSDEDRVRLHEALGRVVKHAEREVFDLLVEREMRSTMLDFGRDSHRQGMIDGLKDAVAAGARVVREDPEPKAHPEAQAPWPEFVDRFYGSRPGMSESTRVSYAQAFKEWQALIGDKNLADIKLRDVGRYSEWLSHKVNDKGITGKLNRKTIVRLVGHICVYTEWAKGAGLLVRIRAPRSPCASRRARNASPRPKGRSAPSHGRNLRRSSTARSTQAATAAITAPGRGRTSTGTLHGGCW